MKYFGLLLALLATHVVAAPGGVRGSVTIGRGHHFQGIEQNRDKTAVSASIAWRTADNLAFGLWVGEFSVPYYQGSSTEVDYFVAWGKQLSFAQRIETSLWHYSYSGEEFSRYDWNQWLTSYHLDERFTFTFGVSEGLFLSNRVSTFAEVTARRNFGRVTTALSIGRNNLSGSPLESFGYVQLKAVYSVGRWHLFADYAEAFGASGSVAQSVVHEGTGLGVSWVF